jgi:hypothetical protein
MRVRVVELTPRRIGDALVRRLGAVPDRLAWFGPGNASNRDQMRSYRDRHRGERCFVLGNGPSLAQTDLSRLRQEVTFGTNRVYLVHQPSYYVCVNELVLEQFTDDIHRLPVPKFLNWNRRRLFAEKDDRRMFVTLALGLADTFGVDPTRQIASGGTVTFVALELAYYMGFREVVLVGVDHRFAEGGTPNRTEVRTQATDENHFHPDYFPKGSRWQLPDLRRSELAYATARRTFEQDGRRIVDATLGGRCPVFEKVDLSAATAQ